MCDILLLYCEFLGQEFPLELESGTFGETIGTSILVGHEVHLQHSNGTKTADYKTWVAHNKLSSVAAALMLSHTRLQTFKITKFTTQDDLT